MSPEDTATRTEFQAALGRWALDDTDGDRAALVSLTVGTAPAWLVRELDAEELERVKVLAVRRGRWPSSTRAARRWAEPPDLADELQAAELQRVADAREHLSWSIGTRAVAGPIPLPHDPRSALRHSRALVPSPRR